MTAPLAHARGYVAMFLSLAASVAPGETVAFSGRAMGTTWTVKFVQPTTPVDADELSRRVAARLEVLEEQFSTYRPRSEVSRFNASGSTDWQPVSGDLVRVALESRRISELTAGAFDVTVEPLVRLWGFGAAGRSTVPPDTAAVAATRRRVDWRGLEARLEPPALRKARPDLALDFSSIAKGFAADAVSELLAQAGATNHFVQVGGDVKTGGRNADGRPWRTGIEEPLEGGGGSLACSVQLEGQALSTSGDYRNFFRAGGRRYGHIIDPRTGEPVSGALAAVSVVHDSCASSSAWATALFVLGAKHGLALATRERLACVFFLREGDRIVRRATPDFERLEWQR